MPSFLNRKGGFLCQKHLILMNNRAKKARQNQSEPRESTFVGVFITLCCEKSLVLADRQQHRRINTTWRDSRRELWPMISVCDCSCAVKFSV
jgi:hypothetical protein